ncbi:MAG: fasciclin domain-containing protein, partial [Actinomycetia bacterium]|nr:fasciclin domain-containing protein [Actinomycetes bacterium]
SVATVNGAEVTISVDGDTVMVNEATVTTVDVEASNGLIHVIDSVLLPPS